MDQATIQSIGMPVIAVLVPLAIAGLKKIIPSIPKFAVPIIATLIGPLFDLGISYIVGVPSTGILGAVAGLAGVGLREIKDQAQKALTDNATPDNSAKPS